MAEEQPVADLIDEAPRGFSVAFALFFFAFGIAAGFLLAFTGLGFLEDSAGVIAGVFLGTILITAVVGMVLLLFRRRILRALFGMAEVQVEHLAGPLAGVAQGVALRDPEAAVGSANRLIRAVMARYAWLSTRRWIMTSLTALIAAMAALAGTALLFKQNGLLGQQMVLMAEQNRRIAQQNALLEQQSELAEAARNAGLASEVSVVVGLLGEATDSLAEGGRLDTADLPRSLVFRLIDLSQRLRPYRFLDPGINAANDDDHGQIAMRQRRAVLASAWERIATENGWSGEPAPIDLIDRAASPERGQLLRAMLASGIHDFTGLIAGRLNLEFAYGPRLNIEDAVMQRVEMPFGDLSHAQMHGVDLRGARLPNIRFRGADLQDVTFAGLPGVETDLVGADFSGAALTGCAFSRAFAMAAVFEDALLIGVDFRDVGLAAASLRNAVLIAPRWEGALLAYADLDGAYVFGADPLAEIAAATQGFDPGLYRADPVAVQAVVDATIWSYHDAALIAARTGGAQAWRLVRTGAFD